MLACPTCQRTYAGSATRCLDDGSALVPERVLAAIDKPLAAGTLVGEYRVDRILGAGAFGTVYAGEQPVIGKLVALKVLHKKLSSDAQAVSRFVSEARAVNRIRHRNIIDVFSFGVLDDGRQYFVMELLAGTTLRELLQREAPVSLERALPILRGIAEGLDAAHEAGITHRDLKPDNVFVVDERGGAVSVKLLDFGVAKLAAEDLAHKTATGLAIGTPRYMSPEQARGRDVSGPSDVYSLGVLVFEMLTGEPLFEGDSVIDVLMQHATAAPRAPSSVDDSLPAALDGPVLAMLAKRPGARPAPAARAIEALATATSELDPATVRAKRPPSARSAETRTEVRALSEFTATIPVVLEEPEPAQDDGRPTLTARPDAASDADSPPHAPAGGSEGLRRPGSESTDDELAPPASSGGPSPQAPLAASRSSGRAPLLALGAAGIGLLLYATGGSPPTEPKRSAEGPGAPPTAGSQITLSMDVQPAGARVRVPGVGTSMASASILLPRSTVPILLELQLPDHHPLSVTVVPDRDQALPRMTLVPLPPPPPSVLFPDARRRSPAPSASNGPRLHRDLDRPPELDAPKARGGPP